ncbi:hypothetical protein TWF696_001651 [Orbilia brochopaga]|uniref:Uncharacterized protein n=1 Tax=Orbilia brochopaga TaxID=3140254 RepID=A0AAV9U600_9PEZI
MAGSQPSYNIVPLQLSDQYGGLSQAKITAWNPHTNQWMSVLPEGLGNSISIRHTVRDTGIHIMAIQKVDLPESEQRGDFLQQEFGRLASLIYGRPHSAGPMLYYLEKRFESRRKTDVLFLSRINFRVLDEGRVFTIRPPESTNNDNPTVSRNDISLALNAMLAAQKRILSCWKDGDLAWVRVESVRFTPSRDGSLKTLQENKNTFRAVSDKVLPWNAIGSISPPALVIEDSRSPNAGNPQIGADTEILASSKLTEITPAESKIIKAQSSFDGSEYPLGWTETGDVVSRRT